MRFIDPNGMYASDMGDDLFSGGGGDAQETKKSMAQQGSKYIAGGAGVKGNLDDIYVNSRGFEIFRIRNNDPDHYYAAERTDYSTWNVYADLGSDAPIPSSTEGALTTIEGMPKLPNLESTLGYMRGHLATGGLSTLNGFNDPIFNIITGASLFSGIAKVASAEKGVIVVGEGMARVEAAASRLQGATILNNMPKFTGTADQITSQMMTYNRQWILQQLRSGKPILDIGRDLNRANPSIFYQMEQNMMKNYLKLHPK